MNSFRRGVFQSNASLTSLIQRFSDVILILSGLYLSCRFLVIEFDINHWVMGLLSIVIFQMIGGMTDFYRSWRGIRVAAEVKVIIKNWSLTIIITLSCIVLTQELDNFLHVFLNWYIVTCLGLILTRSIIRCCLRYLRSLGYNTRRVAIMGSMPIGIGLAETLRDAHWMGFIVLGFYDDNEKKSMGSIKSCGGFDKLVSDAKKGIIDRIYIAMPMEQEQTIKKIVAELSDTTCSVLLIPDVFTFNILQSRSEEINGIPVVSLFDTPMSGVNRVIKRIEDVVLSFLILLFISPVLFIIGFLVKITSPGPIIFKQHRYGLDGKPIVVWKFRSMTVMENDESIVQATKGDIRLTPLGVFLRKTSLDELPQFFNVLKGDMSIVGPRPHAVYHNEQYRKLIRGYMLRHKMKPGITGWAQINGWRGETDTLDKMQKRVEFDLEYIRSWSVWFDMKIIFLTIFKGFINKSAY
ncbi:undecaprenyl-phosphate glucose phosphotransferase [Serratia fonticola]|uniref:undecaprenyl-phosphate glucose phosphotransferase n=1 Tax=Serratia fonticola TaxID=47917 RepID=UPI0021AD6746|nr:undecaprenyl-phosphate glucose phosphotransferase [Serratia fonticola]